jgi:hypothetical protein
VQRYDFNHLEVAASEHIKSENYDAALALYFYMAIGDASLSGGYYAKRIAFCYQRQQKLHAAQYWYLRAIEENPELNADCCLDLKEIGDLDIAEFL